MKRKIDIKKQQKEDIRKKTVTENLKKAGSHGLVKKFSKPKKEYYKEFKRLMHLYHDASKTVTADNIEDIQLLKDDILNHLSLKPVNAYKYAFLYIRQLSMTLRKTLKDPIKSSIHEVYNWQYISSLDLWSEYIAANNKSNELIDYLAYPISKVILGVIRLHPSARWLPLRFHCIKFLNRLAANTSQLCAVLVNIFEIYKEVNFNKKSKKAAKKTLNLEVMLHFSVEQLQTFEHFEQAIDQMFQLIVENISILSKDPDFPNYVVFIISMIRSFCKSCEQQMFTKPLLSLVKKMEQHASFIERQKLSNPLQQIFNNPVFEEFIEKYRAARINELTMILKATRHMKFKTPQEDLEDKERKFGEDENVEGDENEDDDFSSIGDQDSDDESAAVDMDDDDVDME